MIGYGTLPDKGECKQALRLSKEPALGCARANPRLAVLRQESAGAAPLSWIREGHNRKYTELHYKHDIRVCGKILM